MNRLNNKVVMITGVASQPSLGRSMARLFAEQGARLVVTDLETEGLAECEHEVETQGAEVLALEQDVTDEARWKEVVDAALARFGRIDCLVNNAGIAVLRPFAEFTMADYDRQMDVNMRSVFMGCQAVLLSMRAQKSGSIINMSSVAGLIGIPGISAYAVSKGGVRLLSKTLAIEYALEGIRCNSIHPGVIATNIQNVSQRDNPDQFDVINDSIPMGRMGTPEEVANCALFLASDESSYVTGAELVVDGGLVTQ